MLEFINPKKGNIISFRTSGKISEKEVKDVEELIDAKLVNYSALRLLAIIENFEGYESSSALWKDLQTSAAHLKDFERISVVVEEKWIQNITEMTDRITDAEIKVYSKQQEKAAVTWIQENPSQEENNRL